jgi:hypothetical protein
MNAVIHDRRWPEHGLDQHQRHHDPQKPPHAGRHRSLLARALSPTPLYVWDCTATGRFGVLGGPHNEGDELCSSSPYSDRAALSGSAVATALTNALR